ncbi:hypothetical protein HZH68_011872 [Vespula germanica]|uniref:Jun-like transcription factor domain-containing protein n=1 Tax=Vespula germanica TaxID=30212 RepID=A0A834MYI4_VESGE|nr:hypothetical protein HZH68_011872 [Vespula germanica]
MDQTFYEDATSVYGVVNRENNNMGQPKRNLTLDLNSCQRQGQQAKRPRLGPLPTTLNNVAPILSSPDLNMLKLGSPELEKLIIEQQDGSGSIVSSLPTPTAQILFPKTVTEAQELYARGFVDALNELHHSDSSQEPGSLHGATYTTLEPPGSVQSVGTESSDKVKVLKGENSELSAVVHKLKEHVCRLKEQVMDHVQSGCQIMTVSGQF